MDQTSRIFLIIALAILVLLSGFFSAAETALMSITKLRIRAMEERGEKGVALLDKLTDNQTKLLTAILVGNNIVNIGATSIASALFIELFGPSGVALATAIMTIAILIFGEITPKSIAQNNPEKVSLKIAKPISFITWFLSPLVYILYGVKKLTFKILGIKQNVDQPIITEEELKTMVDISHEEGVLEVEEKEIIHNVFEFGDKKAKEAMINRLEIVAINKTASYEEIITLFKEEKFTRLPVYENNLDTIVGLLNVKDIIFLSDEDKENFNIDNYLREAFFTYEYKNVSQLLEDMKKEKAQLALIVNEYGATSGLITMENILEEIVGDIEDEFDNESSPIIQLSQDEFLVDGSASISDVNDQLDLSLSSDNFDSIGGYLIGHLESLPNVNDSFTIDNITFTIDDADKTKINKVRITKDTHVFIA